MQGVEKHFADRFRAVPQWEVELSPEPRVPNIPAGALLQDKTQHDEGERGGLGARQVPVFTLCLFIHSFKIFSFFFGMVGTQS